MSPQQLYATLTPTPQFQATLTTPQMHALLEDGLPIPGPEGPQGEPGPVGPTGPAGPAGADSTVPGPQGPAGATGATGSQGPQGIQGVPGTAGTAGTTGAQGPKGDTGSQGIQGIAGLPNVVQDEGTPITARAALNFVGAGVTATDDAANNRTLVTIPGAAAAPVSSVFTRTGAVVAQTGDYTAAQVTNAVSTVGSYADPSWITSLAYSKLTGVPSTFAPSAHVHSGADITTGTVAAARLGSGTPSSSNFLRGDGSWQVVAAGAAQTPWTSNINGGGFDLTNARWVVATQAVKAESGGAAETMTMTPPSLYWYTGANARWTLQKTGADDLAFFRWNDAGVVVDTALTLSRSSGDVAFGAAARAATISVPADGATDSGAIVFSTRSLGVLGERMRISREGFVGIGLSNPSLKLQVTGDALVSGQMWLNTCTISAYLSTPQILGLQQVQVERSSGTVYYDTAGVFLKGPASADPLIRPPRIAFVLNDSAQFAQIGMDVNGKLRTYSGFQQAATGFAPWQCGVLSANSVNYIASETGANNALVASLENVTLAAGLEVRILLAHTLQAGANTLNLNAGGVKNIRSHRNAANNIATAYAAGAVIYLIYDGTQWQDQSQ